MGTIRAFFDKWSGTFTGIGFGISLFSAINADKQRSEIIELLGKVLALLTGLESRITKRMEELQLESIAGKLVGTRIAFADYLLLDHEDPSKKDLVESTLTNINNDLSIFVIGPLLNRIESALQTESYEEALSAYLTLCVALEFRLISLTELSNIGVMDTHSAVKNGYKMVSNVGSQTNLSLRKALRKEFKIEVNVKVIDLVSGDNVSTKTPTSVSISEYGYTYRNQFHIVATTTSPNVKAEMDTAILAAENSLSTHYELEYQDTFREFLSLHNQFLHLESESQEIEAFNFSNDLNSLILSLY